MSTQASMVSVHGMRTADISSTSYNFLQPLCLHNNLSTFQQTHHNPHQMNQGQSQVLGRKVTKPFYSPDPSSLTPKPTPDQNSYQTTRSSAPEWTTANNTYPNPKEHPPKHITPPPPACNEELQKKYRVRIRHQRETTQSKCCPKEPVSTLFQNIKLTSDQVVGRRPTNKKRHYSIDPQIVTLSSKRCMLRLQLNNNNSSRNRTPLRRQINHLSSRIKKWLKAIRTAQAKELCESRTPMSPE